MTTRLAPSSLEGTQMSNARTALARRSRPVIVGVAGIAVLASVPAMPAAGVPAPAGITTPAATAPASVVPDDVVLIKSSTSLLAEHRWYVQVHEGHPVVDTWFGWHRDLRTGEVTVDDGRADVSDTNTDEPEISGAKATGEAAKSAAVSSAAVDGRQLMVLPETAGTDEARLVWAVQSSDGTGARTSYVDAVTGDVLKTVELSKSARGVGRVFDPNPVAKTQNFGLRDHGDKASAVPKRAYTRKTLPRLTRGKHTLVGRWVRIINPDRVVKQNNRFFFKRSNAYFEQVNAYYAVDAVQNYLQGLGFKHVNAHAQRVGTNAFPEDNSYYNPAEDVILLGKGGVDDAEDPEVVWHEYGHAVQDDQVPNFGIGPRARAIGEAFGDYLAVAMSQRTYEGTNRVPSACVMDWDSTFLRPGSTTLQCLRRVDTELTNAEFDSFDPHYSSQIYSRALWDINQGLGRNRATKVIVEANFSLSPATNFRDAAEATVAAARALYTDHAADIATQAFVDRKIL
jgi:Zn-dependent metalloprotease